MDGPYMSQLMKQITNIIPRRGPVQKWVKVPTWFDVFLGLGDAYLQSG